MKKGKFINALFIIITLVILGVIIKFFDSYFFNKKDDVQDQSQTQSLDTFDLNIQETDKPYTEVETFSKEETVTKTFSRGYKKPRMMVISPFGDLIVTDMNEGVVYAVKDTDGDYVEDERITIIENLDNPHGLAFAGNDLYIAQTSEIRVLRGLKSDYKYVSNSVILKNLSDHKGHVTRTIKIIDGKLYISVGSSCNICKEEDNNRAKILRSNLDGTQLEVVASGLRNSVGFVQSPLDGFIYATDNQRDWLGDELPPDEINKIEFGKSYGWPNCYGDNVLDTTLGLFECNSQEKPFITLGAHVAPLGLMFYSGKMFPEYKDDLFVALHGSWNSTTPVGYEVVRFEDGKSGLKTHFGPKLIDGRNIKGRPVDIIEGKNGEIYISDDFANKIWVMYKN